MESLPAEIISYISSYLSTKDVSASCGVSSSWRNIFGADEVWKHRCDIKLEEHLRTTPCRVTPKFTIPNTRGSKLSPIGRWRLAYMREVHLWKNWVNGNYLKEITGLKDKELYLLNSEYSLMINHNIFSLMGTKVNPPICVTTLEVCPANEHYLFKIVNSQMIVTFSKRNFVRVIEVDYNSQVMFVKHSFCITDSPEESIWIEPIVVDTVLLGFANKCFYIWDLQRGAKLKKEPLSFIVIFPVASWERLPVVYSKDCDDVVICGFQHDRGHCYYIYNIREFRFWPMSLQQADENGHSKCAIIRNYFALYQLPSEIGLNLDPLLGDPDRINSSPVILTVYNYKTSVLVNQFLMDTDCVYAFGDSFIFMSSKKLYQFFPATHLLRIVLTGVSFYRALGDRLILATPSYWELTDDVELFRIRDPLPCLSKFTIKVLVPYVDNMQIGETYTSALITNAEEISYLYFW